MPSSLPVTRNSSQFQSMRLFRVSRLGGSSSRTAGGDVLSSQHGGVGGGLVTVGLDLHATGDTADGLTAGQIGDVDEGVVEGGEDTSNAEDELTCSGGYKLEKNLALAGSAIVAGSLTLAGLGAEGDVLLGGTGGLLGGHVDDVLSVGLLVVVDGQEGRKYHELEFGGGRTL